MKNNIFDISINANGGIDSLVVATDEQALNWLEGEKVYGTPYGKFDVVDVDTSQQNQIKAVYNYRDIW